MSPEVSLLCELWDKVSPFIPKKDRVDVAEEVLRTFDDHIDISEAEEHYNTFDNVMKAALVSHFDIGLDDEDDEDEDF